MLLTDSVVKQRKDSSVGVAITLWDGRTRSPSSIPGRDKIFLLHVVQTGSGAHTASYPMGISVCFPEDKTARASSSPLSPPSTTDVMNDGAIPPLH
jgi:hypothetical protein